MKIGVDIDNTTVGTGTLWLDYLESRFSSKDASYDCGGTCPYNISSAFEIPEDVDAFAFWKDPNLYEGLLPWKDSVNVLKSLKDEGHEIIFISTIKGWHSKSKYYFIDKHFPFKDAVLLTKEKHYVNIDVMIDDNLEVLDKMPQNVKTIRFRKDYVQDSEGKGERKHQVAFNWNEVYSMIHQMERNK